MRALVLVIEDNEQNLYMVTYLLEHAGHRVLQARDGRSGIELAVRHRPDIVLLDVQLPGMDGYEVAGKLRALPGLAKVPIVAVTSHAMAGDRERILSAGCTDYLEKPIDTDTFVDSVVRHVGAGRNGS